MNFQVSYELCCHTQITTTVAPTIMQAIQVIKHLPLSNMFEYSNTSKNDKYSSQSIKFYREIVFNLPAPTFGVSSRKRSLSPMFYQLWKPFHLPNRHTCGNASDKMYRRRLRQPQAGLPGPGPIALKPYSPDRPSHFPPEAPHCCERMAALYRLPAYPACGRSMQ